MSSRRGWFAGSVAVLAVGMLTLGSAGAAGTSNALRFTHEITVDPQRLTGEPNVAIANDGRQMYASGPWGFSTTASFAWKSEDSGAQWDNLHWFCPANPLRPFCSRGGGDSEIQLGSGPKGTVAPSDQPQRVIEVDLNGLDSLTCAYSTDGAKTYSVSGGSGALGTGHVCNIAVGQPPGSDRQWVAIWPKQDQPSGATSDKVYMVYDTGETPPGGDAAAYSYDAGQTWAQGCTTIVPPTCIGGADGFGTRPGPVVLNPHQADSVGGKVNPTLYEFMGTNSNGAEVNISCDGGTTWSHVVIAKNQYGSTTNDFVVGAIDGDGGLYASWATAHGSKPWQVFYSHSTDGAGTPGIGNCPHAVQGGKWSTPAPINDAGALASAARGVHYAVMPWIAAGDPGRVDIAYYGTTKSHIAPDATAATWYLHVAQSLNARAAKPVFTDVVASETPMHQNSICFLGISCTGMGDRNLLDFMEVRPDPQGRAVVIYTDDNNTGQGAPVAGFNGAPIISLVEQVSGPGLYAHVNGGRVTAPPFSLAQSGPGFRTTITDPAGDAPLPAHQSLAGFSATPGPNDDAADITKVQLSQKDAKTLRITFTVKNAHGDFGNAITSSPVPHLGATYLLTWHTHAMRSGAPDDFWFAAATVNNLGGHTFIAGRPVSVFTSSSAKAFEFLQVLPGTAAVSGSFDAAHNRVTIDVPMSAVGGLRNGDVLYGLTGYTENAHPLDGFTSSLGTLTGPFGLFDTSDQTAPIDVKLPIRTSGSTAGSSSNGTGGNGANGNGSGLAATGGRGPTGAALILLGLAGLAGLGLRRQRA